MFIHKEQKYHRMNQHNVSEFIGDFLDHISKEVNRSKNAIYESNKKSLTTVYPLILFAKS